MSVNLRSDLPTPAPEARALSRRLRAHIAAAIATHGGSIPFAHFMELALYAPGLGYYSAGATKFGRAGDFVTAPEVSPLFGRCLARQVAQVLAATGGGDVLELGAGSGRLAVDVLAELQRLHALLGCYYILEVSADLRARQRELVERELPQFVARVQWLDALPAPALRGVVLANEVLDAMPVARVRKRADGGWNELRVAGSEREFVCSDSPLDAGVELLRQIEAIEKEIGELPAGYTTEINRHLEPWLRAIAGRLEAGAAFIIDYGYPRREYYHPQRSDGTLQCHYRHRVHDDPFTLVGLQDITASVDFTAVAEAALAAGFSIAGYTTQAQFLLALGLTELLDESAADPGRHFALSQQAKMLTLPAEMGERFKVIALTKSLHIPLRGFALGDQTARL